MRLCVGGECTGVLLAVDRLRVGLGCFVAGLGVDRVAERVAGTELVHVPGTQLHTHTAPAGIGDPQGRV